MSSGVNNVNNVNGMTGTGVSQTVPGFLQQPQVTPQSQPQMYCQGYGTTWSNMMPNVGEIQNQQAHQLQSQSYN